MTQGANSYGCALKAALTELLRLYDWRNELGRIERDFNHDKKQMTTWLNKYGREKHAAWAVARALLTDAAPQPSTATDSTGPSQEGLGQGDAAAAAPNTRSAGS